MFSKAMGGGSRGQPKYRAIALIQGPHSLLTPLTSVLLPGGNL